MALYGLFNGAGQSPIQQYEGDYMHHQGEYVTIYKNARSDDEADRQVAAIRLDKNQSIREL